MIKIKNEAHYLLAVLVTVFIAFTTFTACKASIIVKDTITIITVKNKSSLNKTSETVEVAWTSLNNYKDLSAAAVIVKSEETGLEIPSQVIYYGEKIPQSIIFQTDIAANSIKKFSVLSGTPEKYTQKTYGRQVPQRFNDFAWENDKVAFRKYGEKLEGNAGMAKGTDFWAKRTSKLIINEWYKSGNYHKDNGDGVDAYHVGMTLGCGDAEPIVGDEIIYPINYSDYQMLDQGPIRMSFKLIYKPFIVNGKTVKETKTISLDAGSQMNKVIINYETQAKLDIAAGVTKHKDDGKVKVDNQNNYLAYWDVADGGKGNGFMGVGIVYMPHLFKYNKETKQHLLIIASTNKNKEFSFYQGAAWSKSGNFANEDAWFTYLANFNENLQHPLKIEIN